MVAMKLELNFSDLKITVPVGRSELGVIPSVFGRRRLDSVRLVH